jgi:ABC-type antimicrobial peptide transport system permease subunit
MAIGATSGYLQSRIVLRTLGLTALGLLGLVASRALSRGLGRLLYGVTAGDPATFIGIAMLLIGVAALVGYIPARKASRIDPMTALQSN